MCQGLCSQSKSSTQKHAFTKSNAQQHLFIKRLVSIVRKRLDCARESETVKSSLRLEIYAFTQHTSAYVSIRQHTSAYVRLDCTRESETVIRKSRYFSISIRQHMLRQQPPSARECETVIRKSRYFSVLTRRKNTQSVLSV